MSKGAQIRVRIEADLKEGAEEILESLGLTPSAAISMLYRQILHRRAIPFEVSLPDTEKAGEAATGEAGEGRRGRWTRPAQGRGFTYGDFPRLFWDARRDAPLDLDDATTMARFLTLGDPQTVASVVTADEIAARLHELPLRPETRAFWEIVLRGGSSEHVTPAGRP